jgi:hypothetical protein
MKSIIHWKTIVFLLSFLTFGHLLNYFFIPYSDKSSFIWANLSEKKIPKSEIDILILGDSQVLSGVMPLELQTEFRNKKIFYYPRPSEQPEGIYYFLLTNVFNDNLKPKLIIWNLSLIGLTKSGIVEAHRKLFKDRVDFNFVVYTDPFLSSFYLKGFIGGLEYTISKLLAYPIVSSQLTTEFSLIPRSLNMNLQSNQLENFTLHNPFKSLLINYERNQFILKNMNENLGYYDWTLDENLEKSSCFQKQTDVSSYHFNLAFNQSREKAFEVWEKIIFNLIQKNIAFKILLIPFHPELKGKTENFILSTFKKNYDYKNFWEISNLTEEDYGDYIHPNSCGAKKITKFLIEKLNEINF